MWGVVRSRLLGRQECRVIVVGLDGAGKSTIVTRLKHGRVEDSEIIRASARCTNSPPEACAALFAAGALSRS